MKKKTNKEIVINSNNIPYDKIKDEKDITFVVVTEDEKVLKSSLKAICEVQKENKDKNITVFVTNAKNYEKLHKESNGKI